ncbi:MAG: hypothetical protein AAF526_02705 [Pseudomonadota bacterium]
MPIKDPEIEQPIPVEWRSVIAGIVEDLRHRRAVQREGPDSQIICDHSTLENLYENIEAYGDRLTNLAEEAWRTSCMRWMEDHWHLLVDLCTVNEGVSDLVLFVELREEKGAKQWTVISVHVP